MNPTRLQDGHKRIVIESIKPSIHKGEYPIKRTPGETVKIQSIIFIDGHDTVHAELLYRHQSEKRWQKKKFSFLGNDLWEAEFLVKSLGYYEYTVRAWPDEFGAWLEGFQKKYLAGQVEKLDFLIGIEILKPYLAVLKTKQEKNSLKTLVEELGNTQLTPQSAFHLLETYQKSFTNPPHPSRVVTSSHILKVRVDRKKSLFSSWYEVFPRSTSTHPNQHGNFQTLENILPYVADLGFDVIYLPPIHPIGITYRKGKNNTLSAEPTDVGSPWAIGNEEGGHKSIHPELGTFKDFENFIQKAKKYNLEVALDIALQCTPDHPYVKKHPEWFKKRPDGSIQYAENPPKKYQDIYPLYFETEDWQNLWKELKSIFEFWIRKGIHIFRVDNPHTKSFRFWRWCIHEIQKQHPEVIFLSEAFTRPYVMYHLAGIGFNQSYTYFTWRHTKFELIQYMEELTKTDLKDYFRPSFWPNTPDILPKQLQHQDSKFFAIRYILAATLSSSYGIYGPAFEKSLNRPKGDGSEEYLDSEKYEIKNWKFEIENKLQSLIKITNHIRKNHKALHNTNSIEFHHIDNPEIIAYTKHNEDFSNIILTVVNLDPNHTQSGWLNFDPVSFGMKNHNNYTVHDLITDKSYTWHGVRNYVELNPQKSPAHIFHLKQHEGGANG